MTPNPLYCEIVASAAQWLRYKRQCMLICTERGLYPWGRPDVFGVDIGRRTIEVEIKLTLSDFRANTQKRSVGLRKIDSCWHPYQFYFFVPPELIDRVTLELPPWAGLISLGTDYGYGLSCRAAAVIKSSPTNKQSPEVSVRSLAEMAKHMSGTLTRLFADRFEQAKKVQTKPLLTVQSEVIGE